MISQKEMVFIREYVIDFNGTRAGIAAGFSSASAASLAYMLLKRDDIKAEVERRKAIQAAKADLKIEDVIKDILAVMRADPAELIEYRRGACRHCYGVEHKYQRTAQEERNAMDAWIKRLQTQCKDAPQAFDALGGIGFSPKKDPHPDCPECHGEGIEYTYARDTRTLSSDAKALYLGTKPTANGIEIKMRDKDKAREQAAKYLGMDKIVIDATLKKAKELTDDELAQIIEADRIANGQKDGGA